MEQKKKRLVVRFVLIVAAVVYSTFAFLIWFSVSSARKIIVKNETADVDVIAGSYAETISNWISTGLNELDMYAQSDVIYNNESPEEIGKWLTTTTTRRSENFDYVLFIDADGNSYYDSGKKEIIKTVHIIRELLQVRQNGVSKTLLLQRLQERFL